MIRTHIARRMACALAIAATVTVAGRARAQSAADSISTVDVAQLAEPTEIINRDAVARAIANRFGRLGPGAAGIVTVAFVVDETGKPVDVQVATSSGFTAVDRAGLVVARVVRFSPATVDGHPVRLRLRMPLSFGVDAPEAIQGDSPPPAQSTP